MVRNKNNLPVTRKPYKEGERFVVPFASAKFVSCIQCKHKHPNAPTCAAYPEGIPEEILDGTENHFKNYPGDNGITFTHK